jgi:hypothetical protein
MFSFINSIQTITIPAKINIFIHIRIIIIIFFFLFISFFLWEKGYYYANTKKPDEKRPTWIFFTHIEKYNIICEIIFWIPIPIMKWRYTCCPMMVHNISKMNNNIKDKKKNTAAARIKRWKNQKKKVHCSRYFKNCAKN